MTEIRSTIFILQFGQLSPQFMPIKVAIAPASWTIFCAFTSPSGTMSAV